MILLLRELGHEVSGFSLPEVKGGLFDLAHLEKDLKHHLIGDVRDSRAIKSALEISKPDFAIHMAAQPLVLRSFEDPIETYTTNVNGTLNFLDAITGLQAPPVSLVVTTDKVYRDNGKGKFEESDPLGGHDPYSASKAMADILTQSWAATNPSLNLHVARSGNVIGAFDVSENRLLPDIIRSVRDGSSVVVRNPEAVRPWQHVLDCLSGYLKLLDASSSAEIKERAFNFGPDSQNFRTVRDLVTESAVQAEGLRVEFVSSPTKFKETLVLTLDSRKANEILKWKNLIGFQKAVNWTLAEFDEKSALEVTSEQIRSFLAMVQRNL